MSPETRSVSAFRVAVALGLVYLVWGSTYLAIRVAVETLPPFLMAALRFLTAGAGMYAFLRLRGVPAPSGIEWRSAGIVGAFLLLGGNGLVVWAEQEVPSGLAALAVSMVPIWMAAADWAWPGGRRPGARASMGLLIGFGGLALLVGPDLRGSDVRLSAALFALLLASPAWAVGSVYARKARLPRSPFMATACEMVAGGGALLAFSLMREEWTRIDWATVSAASWAALAYLTLFGSVVGFSAYVWLLSHVRLTLVSTYAYVNPVVAVLLGWLALGEPVTARTAVAGGIILLAVVLMTTARPVTAGDPGAGETAV